MTKEELFEKFDNVASTKTSIIVACIRSSKKLKDANWQATNGQGELEGLYRGYTDVGEAFGICENLDDMFFTRMFYYRSMIDNELAKFKVERKRK